MSKNTYTFGIFTMPKRYRAAHDAARRPSETNVQTGERMKNNATTDYAMRMVLYIAVKGGLRPSKEISREMGIPQNLLVQLGTQLKEASILQAKLGKHGGYMLAKSASEVSIYDVICAVEKMPQPPNTAGIAEKALADSVLGLYQLAIGQIVSLLSDISIEQIALTATAPQTPGPPREQGSR